MELYTIGHSTHSTEAFVALLQSASVRTLVDVRTTPQSRYNPQFNRKALETTLAQFGIRYVFAGEYLGGRPSDPTCYKSGELPEAGTKYLHQVDYREVMRRPWFVKAVDRLLVYAAETPTAIMCSEGNPEECHRHHLISRFIMENHDSVTVVHLLPKGGRLLAQAVSHSVDDPSHRQLGFDLP